MKYYYSEKWDSFLNKSIEKLLSIEPVSFKNTTPSKLPALPGVYLIYEKVKNKEVALYVGRTKNIRNRLYNNHLMGPVSNARLKKYMTEDDKHACFEDAILAKEYIRENCFVKWIIENDIRKWGALEGYFTARLFPKYGISEEH